MHCFNNTAATEIVFVVVVARWRNKFSGLNSYLCWYPPTRGCVRRGWSGKMYWKSLQSLDSIQSRNLGMASQANRSSTRRMKRGSPIKWRLYCKRSISSCRLELDRSEFSLNLLALNTERRISFARPKQLISLFERLWNFSLGMPKGTCFSRLAAATVVSINSIILIAVRGKL